MKVKIYRCKNNYMWYKDKTPIITEVTEAKNEKELVNSISENNNHKNFYYSPEYKGLILKEDCELIVEYDKKRTKNI